VRVHLRSLREHHVQHGQLVLERPVPPPRVVLLYVHVFDEQGADRFVVELDFAFRAREEETEDTGWGEAGCNLEL
jgi:hypothetical protein